MTRIDRPFLPALTAAIATGLLLLGGCGGQTTADDADTPGGADGADGIDGDTVASNPWGAPAEGNDWRIMFGYRGRLPSTANQTDLFLMGSDGSNKRALTEFAKLDEEDLPDGCSFGCFVSKDLQWITVATGPANAEGGFDLKLGRFNEDLEVSIFKGATLHNVVDFQFAGSRMFYSVPNNCTGASCTYDFKVVDLAENVNEVTTFLTFPPDSQLQDSTYKGHFTASDDGTNLVLLLPTIRSVTVYLWRDGTGLVQLDFICKFGTQGDCSGTGSEYGDTDPIAISPDNRHIVFFTFSDRWQRARVYDTQNPDDIALSIIADVPSGVYIEHACDDGVLADWQWQRVLGTPVFTPDGEEVVFLTHNDCAQGGSPQAKTRTNIRRVKLATLLSGKTLEADDVFSITDNPFGDVTANREVTGFALAGDGATVVFAATPMLGQNGTLIGDGTARQRNDREIYRVRLDGENLQQISNDIEFQAESPQIVAP